MSHANLIQTLRILPEADLSQFRANEQGWADRLQSLAAQAQRRADAARKEIKRRKREAKTA